MDDANILLANITPPPHEKVILAAAGYWRDPPCLLFKPALSGIWCEVVSSAYMQLTEWRALYFLITPHPLPLPILALMPIPISCPSGLPHVLAPVWSLICRTDYSGSWPAPFSWLWSRKQILCLSACPVPSINPLHIHLHLGAFCSQQQRSFSML